MSISHEPSLRVADHEMWLSVEGLRRRQMRQKNAITLILVLSVLLSTIAIVMLRGRELWAQVMSWPVDVVIPEGLTRWIAGVASTTSMRAVAAGSLLILGTVLLLAGLRSRSRASAARHDRAFMEADRPHADERDP